MICRVKWQLNFFYGESTAKVIVPRRQNSAPGPCAKMCPQKYTYTYTHTHTHTQTHIYIHTHAHTHIKHTNIHTHTNTQM